MENNKSLNGLDECVKLAAADKTVQDIYDEAVKYGVQDEPIRDVAIFLCIPKSRGLCGFCNSRKTANCPWPQSSKIYSAICTHFKNKNTKQSTK